MHFRLQVDHVISCKHGGSDELENLASARVFCNLNKGSDLGSLDFTTKELIRFYNPREDKWIDHFQLEDAKIKPLTKIGEVTVRILGFNVDDRILERTILIEAGIFPSAAAMEYLGKI